MLRIFFIIGLLSQPLLSCKYNSFTSSYRDPPRTQRETSSNQSKEEAADSSKGQGTTNESPADKTNGTPTGKTNAPPIPVIPFEDYQNGVVLPSTFTLSKPMPLQVFQRQTAKEGELTFTVKEGLSKVRFLRARLLKDKVPLAADWTVFELGGGLTADKSFTVKAPAGGWYTMEIIAYDENRKVQARTLTDKVGIGEVFLVSGQSNSTNCGAPAQSTTSGLVVSTNGKLWKIAQDPQIGTADEYIPYCLNGSMWPKAGDLLAQKYQVPIAFASTGHSGTEVAHWLPNATNPFSANGAPPSLYTHLRNRAVFLGKNGFRAVLWHQGENDTVTVPPTTSSQYYSRLLNIMKQLETDLGRASIPWFVAQASWCKDGIYPQVNNGSWGESAAVRDAQARLWDLASVYPGPDTDVLKDDSYRRLVSPNQVDCHFSALGLQTVGDMWFRSISAALDTMLK